MALKSAQMKASPHLPSFRYPTVKRRLAANDMCTRFGARLLKLRLDRDMTQAEMAKKFGINRSFISDVERGVVAPSLPMLEVFALGLRISLSEMLEDL